MPPGNARHKPSAKVTERMTALACIEIAQKIQRSRMLAGDQAGSDAARLVAAFIREDLLGEGSSIMGPR